MSRARIRVAAAAAALALLAAACGDGEDRPGQVTSEGGSGSGSASGTGSASGAHGEHGAHGADSEAAFSEAEATTVVPVTLRDFAFQGVPTTVKGPKVLFRGRNEGPSAHEMILRDASGEEIAGAHEYAAGKTKELAVELQPGRYTMVCLVETGDKTHEELGMEFAFTVE